MPHARATRRRPAGLLSDDAPCRRSSCHDLGAVFRGVLLSPEGSAEADPIAALSLAGSVQISTRFLRPKRMRGAHSTKPRHSEERRTRDFQLVSVRPRNGFALTLELRRAGKNKAQPLSFIHSHTPPERRMAHKDVFILAHTRPGRVHRKGVHRHQTCCFFSASKRASGSVTIVFRVIVHPYGHVGDALSHFQEENYKDYLSLWPTVATNEVNTHELDYYAWNIDCLKLIRYIENHIKRTYSKFTHIRSTVKDINRSEDGNITSLVCENGQKIDGDFFIDCTGFKSILKDNKDTISLMDEGRLFVDTALAYRIDYDNDLKPFPYAKCPAVEHGWIWKIPLLTRLGTGLLFNRSITDIEEAKDYFVDHWDNKIDRESLRVIDWTPYYDRNIWDKNVLSVGLSAGFFEPLECTGIGLIIGGITTFITSIQGRYFDDYSIDLYNTYIISQCEDIIDFLSMHYGLSERKGKFWDHVRSTWKPSKSLELIANTLDSPHPSSILNTRPAVMFTHNNWNCWLLQLGYPLKPKSIPDPTFAHNCLKRYTDYIIQNRRTSSNTPLSDFLSQIHKK